jgi:hypothetical protein
MQSIKEAMKKIKYDLAERLRRSVLKSFTVGEMEEPTTADSVKKSLEAIDELKI